MLPQQNAIKHCFKNRVLLFQVKPTEFDPSELLDLLTRFFNILNSLQERSSYYIFLVVWQ